AIHPVEPVEELTDIDFGAALGRALAPPEGEVVQPAGQGPGSPADVDPDEAKVLGTVARLAKPRSRELLVQTCQGLLESLDIVIATLRRVVPAVDEQHDEGIFLLHRLPHDIEGLRGLTRLIEPPLVIGLDELQGVSVLAVYELSGGILAIRRGVVAR